MLNNYYFVLGRGFAVGGVVRVGLTVFLRVGLEAAAGAWERTTIRRRTEAERRISNNGKRFSCLVLGADFFAIYE